VFVGPSFLAVLFSPRWEQDMSPTAIQHLPPFWSGRRSPRLYSPLRRNPLARSRQKYSAHPHRAISHRESPRRQPRLSRLDARLSLSDAPHPCASSRPEPFYPVDRLFPHRHSYSSFLWNLHSRRAGRRRAHRHFQWLDHAQEQRGSRSRPAGPEKSESQRCFSQHFLPSHPPAHRRTRLHFHGHHTWRERASSSRPQLSRDSRRRDWFRASRGEHLHLLRFRRSSRRDHRRKRHEHHPSALFLPSCLHRRPDLLERRECLASFLACSRTVRLLRLAWCIMDFHQRDETRSTEFHRVPQLR